MTTIHGLSCIALRQIIRELNIFQIIALIDTTTDSDSIERALRVSGVVRALPEVVRDDGTTTLVTTTGENFELILRNYMPDAHTVHICRRAFNTQSTRALTCVQDLLNLRNLIIKNYDEIGFFERNMNSLRCVKIVGTHLFIHGLNNLLGCCVNLRELSFLSIYIDYRLPVYVRNSQIATIIIEDCVLNYNVLYTLGKYSIVRDLVCIDNTYQIIQQGRVFAHKEVFDSILYGYFQHLRRLTISVGKIKFDIFPIILLPAIEEITFIVEAGFDVATVVVIFMHLNQTRRILLLRGSVEVNEVKEMIAEIDPELNNDIEIRKF